MVIENNIATIADVIIHIQTVRRFRWLPFLTFTKEISHRDKGYGTILLNAAVQKCKDIGVIEITGNMVGDSKRLEKWYSRNGFKINNSKISMVF